LENNNINIFVVLALLGELELQDQQAAPCMKVKCWLIHHLGNEENFRQGGPTPCLNIMFKNTMSEFEHVGYHQLSSAAFGQPMAWCSDRFRKKSLGFKAYG